MTMLIRTLAAAAAATMLATSAFAQSAREYGAVHHTTPSRTSPLPS